MSLFKLWLRIEVTALAWLAFSLALLCGYAALRSLYWPDPGIFFDPGLSALGVLLFGSLLGSLFVSLFWAPLYALLRRYNRANVFFAAALGVAPGVALAALGADVVPLYAGIAGTFVAVATHLTLGVSPNKSFKPNPLRGSA